MTRIYLYPNVWDPQLRERLRVRVSDVDALAMAACPHCGAQVGESCVYYWNSGQRTDRIEQEQEPMDTTHAERRHVVFDARVRAARWLEQRRLQIWVLTCGEIFREDEG